MIKSRTPNSENTRPSEWYFEENAVYLSQFKDDNGQFADLVGNMIDEYISNSFTAKRWSSGLSIAFGTLLMNLIYRHIKTAGVGCLAVYVGNNYFNAGTPYREYFNFRRKSFVGIINFLEGHKYIIKKAGTANANNRRFTTKIKATEKLLNKMQAIEIDKFAIETDHLVTFRPESEEGDVAKKYPVPVTSAKKRSLTGATQLKKYMNLLDDTDINFGGYYKFDILDKTVYRRFSSAPCKENGRVYGGIHQRLSGEARQHIKINGNSVVELDIISTHPLIAYALNNHDLTAMKEVGKPYSIPGIPIDNKESVDHQLNREILKHALLILFNAKSHDQAIRALSRGFHKRESNINGDAIGWDTQYKAIAHYLSMPTTNTFHVAGELLNRIKDKHLLISNYFESEGWKRLNYQESEICMHVIKYFTAKGIPCLVIHDSMIVEEQYEAELRECLYESIKRQLNMEYSRPDLVIDKKELKTKHRAESWFLDQLRKARSSASFTNNSALFAEGMSVTLESDEENYSLDASIKGGEAVVES